MFFDGQKIALMSISEIIEELPRLCTRIIDLEQERADLEICDQLAEDAFTVLDQTEERDTDHAEAGSR